MNEKTESGLLKSAPDYKNYKVFTVYKSGVLMIENGTAEECAAALGLKNAGSFFTAICNAKNRKRSRYKVEVHYIAELRRQENARAHIDI